MSYQLRLYDTNLIDFDVIENLSKPILKINWINDKKRELMPLGMEVSADGLSSWISHRGIPRNRAYVSSFLAKCGLNSNRPMDVILACRGLSLNDSYWVSTSDDDRSYDSINLYENKISRVLARVAFTGYGSSERSSLDSSPEFTTNGMLPKCWRRENGKIYLYKGGTSGASNTGNEPYSELYAYYIGTRMGMDVVPYHLSKWKGTLCSVCELFTDIDTAFVPIGRLIKNGGMDDVKKYYESLGPEYVKRLNEMIVFDAIICNTDRHFGNFGVLVNSRTNEIISPAPLFDHGNSLFNMAGNYWDSKEELQEYVDTLKPRVYEDFIEEARLAMDNNLREKVRHILNIEVGRIGKYNYSKEKRNLLESQITNRAKLLL